MYSRTLFIALLLAAALPEPNAGALTIGLSSLSSEPMTNPAGDLTAGVTFAVDNCGASSCDVTVRLENLTSGVTYDINQLYFNASFATFDFPDLTYVSATKSDLSVVTGSWIFNEEDAAIDADTNADGFGVFDFSLIDGVGPNPSQVAPGEYIDFLFLGPAGITDADFFELSGPPYDYATVVAAKFVEMDPVGYYTCGPNGDQPCDSAFGAAIPEPSTLTLIGLGVAGLACNRRGGCRGRR